MKSDKLRSSLAASVRCAGERFMASGKIEEPSGGTGSELGRIGSQQTLRWRKLDSNLRFRRPIFNSFEVWSELEPIDPRRGGTDQVRGIRGAAAHAESGGVTAGGRSRIKATLRASR